MSASRTCAAKARSEIHPVQGPRRLDPATGRGHERGEQVQRDDRPLEPEFLRVALGQMQGFPRGHQDLRAGFGEGADGPQAARSELLRPGEKGAVEVHRYDSGKHPQMVTRATDTRER